MCTIAENSDTIQYANIDESVKLLCKPRKGTEGRRWLRHGFILTDEQNINGLNPSHRRLTLDMTSDATQYNLQLANVSVDDFGLYICEMQTSEGISSKRVTLTFKGNK